MCIILSLLSPEYATSQQAGATSIPEENVPQSGRKGKWPHAQHVALLVTIKPAIYVP
jgi:hypothetical protein